MAGHVRKPDFEAILREAHAAAAEAVRGLPDHGACGFAWAKVPGNSPIACWARAEQRRRSDDNDMLCLADARFLGERGYPAGHEWWKPGDFHGQSLEAHEAGAKAFREVLARYGISAEVGSRLD